MRTFEYVHVDVFTNRQLQGNGLAVVFCHEALRDAELLDLAREFKQFETIFLSGYDGEAADARIFTMDGELPFAGHPVLGAAAALHARRHPGQDRLSLRLRLAEKDVAVDCVRTENGFRAEMCQGEPAFLRDIPPQDAAWLAAAHNIPMEHLDATLPMQVVSTGLPYLLIPVTDGLAQARITIRDLEPRIAAFGASYTYLLNTRTHEARTWDNLGLVEDTATGSAAGPSCAYLVRHGRLREGDILTLSQGAYANRPATLTAQQRDGKIYVSGDIVLFAKGRFTIP